MKMAEYTKAVVDGRPAFHINLVVDVSPYCDCHPENDVPILPDIGMFASFDPVALDQACADACNAQQPVPGSILDENMHAEGFCDHHDHFIILRLKASGRPALHMQRRSGWGAESTN